MGPFRAAEEFSTEEGEGDVLYIPPASTSGWSEHGDRSPEPDTALEAATVCTGSHRDWIRPVDYLSSDPDQGRLNVDRYEGTVMVPCLCQGPNRPPCNQLLPGRLNASDTVLTRVDVELELGEQRAWQAYCEFVILALAERRRIMHEVKDWISSQPCMPGEDPENNIWPECPYSDEPHMIMDLMFVEQCHKIHDDIEAFEETCLSTWPSPLECELMWREECVRRAERERDSLLSQTSVRQEIEFHSVNSTCNTI